MTEPKTYRTIARLYDLLDLPFEHFRYRRIRPQLWQGFTGRVLDAGVGTGRNMPYYRRCCRILAVEDSHRESMRLDGPHQQAITRPLPHDELVQPYCFAAQARRAADLAGQGHDMARAA